MLHHAIDDDRRIIHVFNLLGHAARRVIEIAARVLKRDVSELANDAGIPIVLTNGGGVARIAATTIAFNTTGFSGATTSFGNNRVTGNTVLGTVPGPAGAPTSAFGQQ